MKRKQRITSLILCAAMLSAMMLLVSCGNKEEEVPIVNPISISVSIDYPGESKITDITADNFKIEENSTVLDATQLYCNVNDISVNIETTDSSVMGFNGLQNGDTENMTWKYKINDVVMTDSPGTTVLADGDHLVWFYAE